MLAGDAGVSQGEAEQRGREVTTAHAALARRVRDLLVARRARAGMQAGARNAKRSSSVEARRRCRRS